MDVYTCTYVFRERPSILSFYIQFQAATIFGWQSAVGGWRWLAVGSWQLVVVGGWWRLVAIGGWLSLGAVLQGGLWQKKMDSRRTALSVAVIRRTFITNCTHEVLRRTAAGAKPVQTRLMPKYAKVCKALAEGAPDAIWSFLKTRRTSAANHQPHQPPIANHQPPPTATNRQSPPTGNCHSPPTMVEHMSTRGVFWENYATEHYFPPLRTALATL